MSLLIVLLILFCLLEKKSYIEKFEVDVDNGTNNVLISTVNGEIKEKSSNTTKINTKNLILNLGSNLKVKNVLYTDKICDNVDHAQIPKYSCIELNTDGISLVTRNSQTQSIINKFYLSKDGDSIKHYNDSSTEPVWTTDISKNEWTTSQKKTELPSCNWNGLASIDTSYSTNTRIICEDFKLKRMGIGA